MPLRICSQECLTGLLPYDENDSYQNFGEQLEHLEYQANHMDTVLPPKLDSAHDLQSVLGATAPCLKVSGVGGEGVVACDRYWNSVRFHHISNEHSRMKYVGVRCPCTKTKSTKCSVLGTRCCTASFAGVKSKSDANKNVVIICHNSLRLVSPSGGGGGEREREIMVYAQFEMKITFSHLFVHIHIVMSFIIHNCGVRAFFHRSWLVLNVSKNWY